MVALVAWFDAALQRLASAISRLLGVKPSLAFLLSLLTIVTLVPPLVFGAWLFHRNAIERRLADENRLAEFASTLVSAVDREMRGWRKTVEVAATAAPTRADQFEAFHAWASDLVSKVDGHFFLVDSSGRQLVNTRFPFGAVLTGFSDGATLQRVFETGRATNSNLFVSRTANKLVFDIHVPIKSGDTVLFSLVYSPDLANLQRIVSQHSLPSGWVAAIVDGNGRLAAGSIVAPSSVIGSPVPARLQDRIVAAETGLIHINDVGGGPSLVGYNLSTNTGWRAIVSAPIAVLEMPTGTVRLAGLIFLGGILLLSTGAAVLTSALIRRPMHLATAAAMALARGDPVNPKRTFMAETEVLASAITTAAQEIEARRLALQESEARAQLLANASPAILWATSPDKTLWVSDRWYEYTGLPRPMPLRGWSEHLHPDDRARCRQEWRQSMIEGTELRTQARIRGKDATYRWFHLQSIPQRDETGRIVMWYGSATDIDDLKNFQQSLTGIEQRLRLAQDIAGIGTIEWDLRTDRGAWSANFANLIGLETDGWEGQSGDEVLAQIVARMPAEEADNFMGLREELLTQREFTREFRLMSQDGAMRWVHLKGEIIEGDDGARRLIVVARDVTRRKLDELDRARFVTVAEASREAIIGISLAGRIEVWNKAAESLYGWTTEEIRGKTAQILNHPNATVDIADLIARAAVGEHIGPLDVMHRTRDGETIEINMSLGPVRDPRGAVIAVSMSANDTAERKRQEAESRWVMRELSHRSKNLLAIVQSMAGQTARSASSLEQFQCRFSDRIAALARSHDLLVGRQWRGALMHDLITTQVMPFATWDPGHVIAHGPVQMLKPEAAQALGMALHELAHNAAKYGALSVPTGTIEVTWDVVPGTPTAAPTFSFVWRERGGPMDTTEHRQGFGRTVIERLTPSSLQGTGMMEWTSEGLIWLLKAPLSNVTHSADDEPAEHTAFDFGSTSRELIQLYRVWSDLRSGGRLPSLGDLVASEIGRHEAVFVAVEVGDDLTRMNLITVGGRLAEMLGGSAPEIMSISPLGRALTRELLRRRGTASMANPCYFCIGVEEATGRQSHEVLVVPVSSDGDAVSHFIGMVLPIES